MKSPRPRVPRRSRISCPSQRRMSRQLRAKTIAKSDETTEVAATDEVVPAEAASEATPPVVSGEGSEPAAAEAAAVVPCEPIPAQQEPAAKPAPVAAAPKKKATADEAVQSSPKESSVANQSIRVNVGVLENLMTMVSELVLTRNQLLQILRTQKETEFAAPLQRLNHVVSELQEGVMQTRMQPIGNAWAKLPRIIRGPVPRAGQEDRSGDERPGH